MTANECQGEIEEIKRFYDVNTYFLRISKQFLFISRFYIFTGETGEMQRKDTRSQKSIREVGRKEET